MLQNTQENVSSSVGSTSTGTGGYQTGTGTPQREKSKLKITSEEAPEKSGGCC